MVFEEHLLLDCSEGPVWREASVGQLIQASNMELPNFPKIAPESGSVRREANMGQFT